MKSAAKQRLDLLLVTHKLFESRQKAQRAILAGEVFVDGQRVDKPGTPVRTDALLHTVAKERFVSRGGQKMEAALSSFSISPLGWTCVDIGASTGGFTDCLLQHGAARVYAYDVGHSQLDWKIRSDPRVVVREKFNARYLTPSDLPEPIQLGVVDVSFISLNLILGPLTEGIDASIKGPGTGGGVIIMLVKPQFELERAAIGAGGIVRDTSLHLLAVEKIKTFVASRLPRWQWVGVIDSPILGTEGNKEFLACLKS